MKQFKFKVTKHDIKMGFFRNGRNCPISRSVRRRFQELVGANPFQVTTALDYVTILENGIYLDSITSKKTQKFVKDFDAGKKVKPFTGILKFK